MRHPGHPQLRQILRAQILAQPGQAPEPLPRFGRQVRNRPHRHRRLTQHHLVSVTAEFVDRTHRLELHLHRGDVGKVLRQSRKELRRQQQFLLGNHFPAHPLTHHRGGVLATGGVGAQHPGGERPQQRQVAHVADEQRPARRQ